MARISAPIFEIRSLRYSEDDTLYIENIYRNYARINKKFIPIGWYVAWSDGVESVILDANVPSTMTAMNLYIGE